jgi:hypothetical protein
LGEARPESTGSTGIDRIDPVARVEFWSIQVDQGERSPK